MSSDNTATAASSTEVPPVYRTPEGLRTLANYLRSHVRVKSGVEFDKRVDYFKGFRLVECILEGKKWPKSLPRVEDKETAIQLGDLLIEGNFFHRSEKIKGKKRYLKLCDKRNFEEKGHFTWMFSGNMMWSNLATGLIIVAVIGFTLLPIWPDAAKKILWYLSVTFLIATVAFCLVRFLLFLLLWILGFDFWIFPRLFDETLSVKDSFIPLYSFDKGSAGQGAYRLGMVALLAASTYWAISQPTAFDSFVQAQSDFVSDLYSGKLLADVAFDPRDHLDRNKRVPSLEDLLKELENDEKSITDKPREEVDNENDSEAAERRAGEAEGETETEAEGNPFEHDEE